MKTLCVLQHVQAEFLGLLEDHFEGRNIRFHYCRPFAPGTKVPASAEAMTVWCCSAPVRTDSSAAV